MWVTKIGLANIYAHLLFICDKALEKRHIQVHDTMKHATRHMTIDLFWNSGLMKSKL